MSNQDINITRSPGQLNDARNIIDMLKVIRSRVLSIENPNHRDMYASEYIGMAIILLESKEYTGEDNKLIDNVNAILNNNNYEITD